MSNLASKTLQNSAIFEKNAATPSEFKLAVFTKDEVRRCRHWATAFGDERKDHRYYELVEDTIHPEFDYRYFVIQDEKGEVRAAQPFFLLDQDMLAGTSGWILRWAEGVRRWWPGFLKLRTMMVGCAAGEGHLDSTSELPRPVLTQILAAGIADHARQLKARMIVLKEFPAADRDAFECFVDHGYTRVPSMPMTEVGIKYAGFDEYTNKLLSRNTRAKLRQKFRAIEGKQPEMSVLRDITPVIDKVYPLYLNVYEKAKLKFEKLSKEFFCKIGREMPDKVRFFCWTHDDKIVAFGMCMVNGTSICSEYIGFDYNVAFNLHLYYVVVRDIMSWAMANGYTSYRSTGLNYEPKYHLRYHLDPLDLYVRHTSPIFNLGMKYILPLVEPTRYDKMLQRFANYKELWPAEGNGRVPTAP